MKNKYLHLAAMLILIPTLASCSIVNAFINGYKGLSSEINSMTDSAQTSTSDSTSSSGSSDVSSNTTTSSTNTTISSSDINEENVGYYKPDSMSFKATDYDEGFSPSTGNVNLLIIPIEFKASSYTITYQQSDFDKINDRYFGSASDSLKNYYSKASFGKLNLSGTISSVYKVNVTGSAAAKYDEKAFYSLLNSAYSWTLANNPTIDFSKFDSNNDGYVDSVHFLTNLSSTAFDGSVSSDGFLWPHMYFMNNSKGTHEKPSVNVYLCTTYGFIDDTTSIHEQGHVFGVDDYYNYTRSSSADYVGGADMQDLNCMDWNSYSKMLMNWVQPYVIDGTSDSVTLTINPASSSGDCILIPASNATWNGSAYSEYILLELFTNTGNNSLFWDKWQSIAYEYGLSGAGALGNGGVRMYHVDSRLYGFNNYKTTNNINYISDGEYIDNPASNPYNYCYLPQTNSANNYDYADFVVSTSKNYKLLSLIQAGKTNTFKTGTSRNALNRSDLFQTGNVFNMSSYSSFFNNGKFNNGETFPYTITFDSVTTKNATITISK